jgi:hypothetical protein
VIGIEFGNNVQELLIRHQYIIYAWACLYMQGVRLYPVTHWTDFLISTYQLGFKGGHTISQARFSIPCCLVLITFGLNFLILNLLNCWLTISEEYYISGVHSVGELSPTMVHTACGLGLSLCVSATVLVLCVLEVLSMPSVIFFLCFKIELPVSPKVLIHFRFG